MNIREEREQWEENYFSEYACKSSQSKGRMIAEIECDIRTVFQKDRDRIIHSKAFRRLKHKTQVFISSDLGDHYRTRLTHTLEVAQISRTIARALKLNEDLAEAIAMGHDLGHTPFGHSGEDELNKLSKLGFKHNKQSLRVVDTIEKHGKGLNLSYEVRNGILCHTGKKDPDTLEGQIVKIADRIAYINHDIDDGLRAGLLKMKEIPSSYLQILGETHSQRINTLVFDMIKASKNKNKIEQSPEVKGAMLSLRTFLFENFYIKDEIRVKLKKGKKIIRVIYKYYMKNYQEIEENFEKDRERKVLDYVSGMTDLYAIKKFKEIYLP